MKNRLTLVAAVTGAVVGVIWTIAGQAFESAYWQPWVSGPSRIVRWIAFASCPFLDLYYHRLSIVVVPLLNAIIYSLLVYVTLRFAKRPAIPAAIILGYAVGVFFVICADAGNQGADWPPYFGHWLVSTTCPFVGYIGMSGLATGLVPLLNASLYGLLVYALMGVIRRLSARLQNSSTVRN